MKKNGFSLIELLVVVTILAILFTIGIAAFRNVSANARDAKRKADVDAIAKALESQFNSDTGQYPVKLEDSYFTGGSIPQKPESGLYDLTWTGGDDHTGFQACAPLEVAPPDTVCPATDPTYCYCKKSSQGKYEN